MRNQKTIAIACLAMMAISAQAQTPQGYEPVKYHEITLGAAKTMTAAFQGVNPTPVISPSAQTVNASDVRRLLSERQATYVREYFALDEKGLLRILLVGKTSDGKDILTNRILVSDGSTVSQQQAKAWIRAFSASPMFAQYGGIYAGSVHRDALAQVITKNNASSLRFYPVLEEGRLAVAVAGVLASGVESSTYIVNRNCCPPLSNEQGELAQ